MLTSQPAPSRARDCSLTRSLSFSLFLPAHFSEKPPISETKAFSINVLEMADASSHRMRRKRISSAHLTLTPLPRAASTLFKVEGKFMPTSAFLSTKL